MLPVTDIVDVVNTVTMAPPTTGMSTGMNCDMGLLGCPTAVPSDALKARLAGYSPGKMSAPPATAT